MSSPSTCSFQSKLLEPPASVRELQTLRDALVVLETDHESMKKEYQAMRVAAGLIAGSLPEGYTSAFVAFFNAHSEAEQPKMIREQQRRIDAQAEEISKQRKRIDEQQRRIDEPRRMVDMVGRHDPMDPRISLHASSISSSSASLRVPAVAAVVPYQPSWLQTLPFLCEFATSIWKTKRISTTPQVDSGDAFLASLPSKICMLTFHERPDLVGAHIVPRRYARKPSDYIKHDMFLCHLRAEMVEIAGDTDIIQAINSPRNGLVLHRMFELHYDAFWWCLVPEQTNPPTCRVHVFFSHFHNGEWKFDPNLPLVSQKAIERPPESHVSWKDIKTNCPVRGNVSCRLLLLHALQCCVHFTQQVVEKKHSLLEIQRIRMVVGFINTCVARLQHPPMPHDSSRGSTPSSATAASESRDDSRPPSPPGDRRGAFVTLGKFQQAFQTLQDELEKLDVPANHRPPQADGKDTDAASDLRGGSVSDPSTAAALHPGPAASAPPPAAAAGPMKGPRHVDGESGALIEEFVATGGECMTWSTLCEVADAVERLTGQHVSKSVGGRRRRTLRNMRWDLLAAMKEREKRTLTPQITGMHLDGRISLTDTPSPRYAQGHNPD